MGIMVAPRPPRILLIADAGVHSGFGTVTHNIFDRLVENYGYDVHTLAVNWRGDHWPTPQKMYLPTQKIPTDLYGKSRYIELVGKLMPDAIAFINDPAVVRDALLANPFDEQQAIFRGITNGSDVYKPPIIAYMPIDGYNSPKSWDVLSPRVTRVAMSKFGRDTAMPEAPVVWHGVDTEIFRQRDKREAKVSLGFDPDRFLVLRVDKNSFRKDYPASWKALRPLLRKYTDIDVHFHCLPRADDGYDLHAIRWNDEDVRGRVSFSENLVLDGYLGVSTEQLATLYSAADVFISTSWGEGFGLTLLEAMASGTPVVAQNCSSITEVVGDGGVLIEPAGRISTPMGQDQSLPDIGAFTAAIERLYQGGGSRRKLAAKAVEQASRMSWEIAAARMDEVFRREVANAVQQSSRPPVSDQVEVPVG